MNISMDIKEKLKQFCIHKNIALMVLFGSRALGKSHKRSDFDIALLSENDQSKSKKLYYIAQLEQILKVTVDIVLLKSIVDPLLLQEIFKTGQLIYEERQGLFDDQRYRAWAKYLDTRELREREKQFIQSFNLEEIDVS